MALKMMSRRDFQLPYLDGAVKVYFYIIHNPAITSIGEIYIHSPREVYLPQRPTIEWHEGKCKLVQTAFNAHNGQLIKSITYFDTPLSNAIVTDILRIKAEETPKLHVN